MGGNTMTGRGALVLSVALAACAACGAALAPARPTPAVVDVAAVPETARSASAEPSTMDAASAEAEALEDASDENVLAPDAQVVDLRLLGIVSSSDPAKNKAMLVAGDAGTGWVVSVGDRVGAEDRTTAGCPRRWRVARMTASTLLLEGESPGCPKASRELVIQP